jgi:hypothetical protein
MGAVLMAGASPPGAGNILAVTAEVVRGYNEV